jgi:hypothetical protein
MISGSIRMRKPEGNILSGSKWRPLLAVVEPAKMRWMTPVERIWFAGAAAVRPRRVVAARAREVKPTMMIDWRECSWVVE